MALVLLLALGVGAALVWPNDAERKATSLRVGMPILEVVDVLGPQGDSDRNLYHDEVPAPVVGAGVVVLLCSSFGQGPFLSAAAFAHGRTEVPEHFWAQQDGSAVSVVFRSPDGSSQDSDLEPWREMQLVVASFRTTPPPTVHPLTRLCRTLARILPFLKE